MRARELTENIGAYIREHMSESEKSAMRMEEYIKHSDLNAGGNNYTRYMIRKPLMCFQQSWIGPMGFLRKSFRNIWMTRNIGDYFPFQRN